MINYPLACEQVCVYIAEKEEFYTKKERLTLNLVNEEKEVHLKCHIAFNNMLRKEVD